MKAEQKETASVVLRKNTPMPIATIADMQAVGTAIAQSGMFGITNAGAGLVIAMTCHSQNISLLEFARTYHIINGRPSMRSDAMLAEFRKRGGKYVIAENSVTRAAADFEFEGQKFSGAYTMEDAERSGDCFDKDGKTLKHNWLHRAENMLWARMVSRTVRILCPEIVAGIYTPEEVEDFHGPDNARVVRPIPVAEATERAASVVLEPEVIPDFTKHPALNVNFETLTNEDLKNAWDDPCITEDHRKAISAVVEARLQKEGKA